MLSTQCLTRNLLAVSPHPTFFDPNGYTKSQFAMLVRKVCDSRPTLHFLSTGQNARTGLELELSLREH